MTSRKTNPRQNPSRSRPGRNRSAGAPRKRASRSRLPADPTVTLEPVIAVEKGRAASAPVDPPSGLPTSATEANSPRVYLVARGPDSLFAYWNWSEERLAAVAREADDSCVLLRLRRADGTIREEHALPPGCRNWYFSLPEGGQSFSVELGAYQVRESQRVFRPFGSSPSVTLPRFSPSERTDQTLVTLPPQIPFGRLAEELDPLSHPGERIAETLARLQQAPGEGPSPVSPELLSRWTAGWAASQTAGSFGGSPSSFGLVSWPGSFPWPGSVTALPGSLAWTGAAIGWPGSLAWPGSFVWPSSWAFSPFGASWGLPPGGGRERGFFLHVNAELILYGGTDPKARVTVLGEPIPLQPDGTFRYHFLLPDGSYRIPIEALSPDKVETRGATLSFLRQSDYQGKVDATPQPPLPPEPLGRIPG